MVDRDAGLAYLIDQLYEAAIDPLRWKAFADALDRHLDGAYVQFHAHDYVSNLNTGTVVSRHPVEFVESYRAYYHRLNPIVPHLTSAPIGRVFRTEEFVDLKGLARSEYYNDWFLPQEDSAVGCGAVLYRDEQRLFIFGAHLPARHVEKKIETLHHLISDLVPHLRRAMQVHRAVARAGDAANEFRQAVDQVSDAVFQLDGLGRVQWMNAGAERLCTREGRFCVDPTGRVFTGDEDLDGQIRAYCSSTNIQVLRFVIDRRSKEGSFLVGHLVAAHGLPTIWSGLEPNVRATLCLQNVAGPDGWTTLVGHFRLTRAEIALCRDLVRGASLDEIAATRRTSIHTVRNQLRTLMEKTGTHRQSELVALLAPFSAPQA